MHTVCAHKPGALHILPGVSHGQCSCQRLCKGIRLRRTTPCCRRASRPWRPVVAHASVAERVSATTKNFKVPDHWQQHLKGMAGGKQRVLHRYFQLVKEISDLEPSMQRLTDEQLKAKTAEFRQRLKAGAQLDDLLVEAFAVVREVSSRVLRLRHFDAQLVGGVVLHEGSIAEMKTGEGKTLVATLPTYLNALTGQGVHVVTVNDYLAERDGNWMGRVFKFLGLTVGIVTDATPYAARGKQFDTDVLYITAMQLTFTYLYDNTARYSYQVAIKRPFHYAIVDEVDSILIDDCRNPMLISGSSQKPVDRFRVASEVVQDLEEEVEAAPGKKHWQRGDFTLDVKQRQASLTEDGLIKVYIALSIHNELIPPNQDPVMVWEEEDPWGPYLINAIKAQHLYKKNVDYIVDDDGKVKIINRSTGRVQTKSRWTDNIHQAVEAKEKLEIGHDSLTQASITYQMFFRYYHKLAGMTGTAITEAEEFFDVYKLNIIQVPSRLPSQRHDHMTRVYCSNEGKLVSIYTIVIQAYKQRRPVLIGTSSVAESETILSLLAGSYWLSEERPITFPRIYLGCDLKGIHTKRYWREYVTHYEEKVKPKDLALLNAKPENVRREAQIIAQAGLPGAVTIATNMAGRGTDIVLGGNPKGLALQTLMKLFASYFLTGHEYKANKAALDQVPLEQFAWEGPQTIFGVKQAPAHGQDPPVNAKPPPANMQQAPANGQQQPLHGAAANKQQETVNGSQPSPGGPAQPTSGQLEDLEALKAILNRNLPGPLAKRLWYTALVCCVSRADKTTLDTTQTVFSRVLDQAEALQAQIVTDTWGLVGAYDAKSHAAEATAKADELFQNDQVPTFQQPSAAALAGLPGKSAMLGRKDMGVNLEVQKHLAWSAVHLLFYLETECQAMAQDVKDKKGLLVLSTGFHDSRRSANQLKGRAGRQGDPGETLMMYDFEDSAALGEAMVATARAIFDFGRKTGGADPYMEGIVVDKGLQPLITGMESTHRSMRDSLKQFDEVMEQFRQHTYALRRLILYGTSAQSIEMLQLYFQDSADMWVERIIDAKKPVHQWDWESLLEQVNKLLIPGEQPNPQVTVEFPQASNAKIADIFPSSFSSSSSSTSSIPLPASAAPAVFPSSSTTPSASPSSSSPSAPAVSAPSSSQNAHSQPASNGAGSTRLSHQSSNHSSAEASTSSPSSHLPSPKTQPPPPGAQSPPPGAQPPPLSTQPPPLSTQPPPLSTQPHALKLTPEEKASFQKIEKSFGLDRENLAPKPPVDVDTRIGKEAVTAEELRTVSVNVGTRIGIGAMTAEELQTVRDALQRSEFVESPGLPSRDPYYIAKILSHKEALKKSEQGSKGRPRIKGRYGRKAEQLRNWLGEYLIAKYDKMISVDSAKKTTSRSLDWERDMMLDTLDDIWMHFLKDTASLHSGMGLRVYSHMDPVDEFKLEAGAAFVQALTEFRQECVWQAFCGPKLHALNVKAQLREAFNKAQVEASAARGSVTKPPSSPPNAGAAPQIGASAANGSTSSANKSAGKESGQKSLSLSGPTQTS